MMYCIYLANFQNSFHIIRSCVLPMMNECQRSGFNPKSMQDQSIRIHKAHKYTHLSDGELLKTFNFIRSTSKEEKNLFTHIKQVGVYSEDRKETFIRFNFRTIENSIGSQITSAMENSCKKNGPRQLKALSRKHFKKEGFYRKGTMNVNELWCDKNLQQVMGFPLYPKDRIKILNYYKNNNADLSQWAQKSIP